MSGTVTSNNFPGFTAGRQYVLTLTLSRTAASSLAFTASWQDTSPAEHYTNSATNSSATSFRFDGLALWSQAASTAATNITLNEFKVDYIPQPPTARRAGQHDDLLHAGRLAADAKFDALHRRGATGVSQGRAGGRLCTGWTPSGVAWRITVRPPFPANAQVTRSVSGNGSAAPVVTFNVTPAQCELYRITEALVPGLSATSVSSGGNYVASNNVVLWGPFFGTNVLSLSYQAVGLPGVYPVSASWSVDGVGGMKRLGLISSLLAAE